MIRALLIRHPWIDLILDGKKTWEIRGSRTAIRGTIALIPSASGTVAGACEVIDCVGPLSPHALRENAAKAGMGPAEAVITRYRDTYAWVLTNPKRFNKPIPYEHPGGAVIWVKLTGKTEQAIRVRSR